MKTKWLNSFVLVVWHAVARVPTILDQALLIAVASKSQIASKCKEVSKIHCDIENTLRCQVFKLWIEHVLYSSECVSEILDEARKPPNTLQLQGCDCELQRSFLAQRDWCDYGTMISCLFQLKEVRSLKILPNHLGCVMAIAWVTTLKTPKHSFFSVSPADAWTKGQINLMHLQMLLLLRTLRITSQKKGGSKLLIWGV